MDDPRFHRYLDYLRYWARPEYAVHVKYPHGLFFLERLRDPAFRKVRRPRLAPRGTIVRCGQALRLPAFVEMLRSQQELYWRFHFNSRRDPVREHCAAQGEVTGADDVSGCL